MTLEPYSKVQVRDVMFPNGNCARAVFPALGTPVEDVIAALQLPPYQEVIVLYGSAGSFGQLEQTQQFRLTQLISRGIPRAATTIRALIVDGGTESGVMQLIGRGVADHGRRTPLIGIAPRGAVTFPGDPEPPHGAEIAALDANHSHFVLGPGQEFGDESPLIPALVTGLIHPLPADGASPHDGLPKEPLAMSRPQGQLENEKTALVVLGGGNVSGVVKTDILLAVRRGFRIIVLEGTGGLADEIAALFKVRPMSIPDASVAEIIEDGNLQVFEKTKPVGALEHLIVCELGVNNTLEEAWKRFGAYDAKAKELQRNHNLIQPLILLLGVAAALSVATRASLVEFGLDGLLKVPWWLASFPLADNDKLGLAMLLERVLYGAIVLIPILTATLLAYAAKFSPGARWVVYRSAAEGIRRAIYVYRTRSRGFHAKPGELPGGMAQGQSEAQAEITREMELQRRVQFISSQLMQSDANAAGLPLYEGPIPPQETNKNKQWNAVQDDGATFLTPARYIELRLEDQIRFYRKRTVSNETELQRWQIAALAAGGLGTLLAAIGWQLWVTVTTALATAAVAYLEYRQTRMTIVHYNQAATNLENLRLWWAALPPEDQAEERNIQRLVETTEEILGAEMVGWVQQMQDALGKLRVEQAKQGEGEH